MLLTNDDIAQFVTKTDMSEEDRGKLLWHVEHCNRCLSILKQKKEVNVQTKS